MNRAEKKALIEQTNEKLQGADIALVVHNNGLTVAQMTELRSSMREAGAEFKIAKNRLVKLALKDTKFEELDGMLNGPTALATSESPVKVSKGLVEFAKNNDKLVILGGVYGEKIIDEAGVKALAALPTIDELRAKLISMLQTPATRIAGVLQAPGGQVARVISAKSQQG